MSTMAENEKPDDQDPIFAITAPAMFRIYASLKAGRRGHTALLAVAEWLARGDDDADARDKIESIVMGAIGEYDKPDQTV